MTKPERKRRAGLLLGARLVFLFYIMHFATVHAVKNWLIGNRKQEGQAHANADS